MKFLRYLDKVLYSFFGFFFIFYIAKFGITSFIVPGTNYWTSILNLGIWFVLVSYCVERVIPEPKEKVRFKR